MDEKHAAEVLFGNPGGSPGDPGNIETALNAAFRPLQDGARGERNHDLAREIGEVRATLGNEMLSLGFSDAAAKEFSGLIGEYYSRPRDDEGMKNNLDNALDELSTEWGADFHARLEGAEKVMASLTKGNPRLLDFMHSTGLSRDARFLRLVGEVARHRAAMPAGSAAKVQPAAQRGADGKTKQALAALRERSSSNKGRSSNSNLANALYGKKG